MKNLLQFSASDGSELFVEVSDLIINEPTRSGSNEINSRGFIQETKESFDKSLKPLREISDSIIRCVKEISDSPSEIELELGLTFTAKTGIILTSFDSEAHIKITFKWINEKADKIA